MVVSRNKKKSSKVSKRDEFWWFYKFKEEPGPFSVYLSLVASVLMSHFFCLYDKFSGLKV